MSRLNAISNALSYTDFIPFVSIPSGIVHLTCAIRDRIFGASKEIKDPKETFKALVSRKLDDWTHLQKGLLAVIPFLGNFVLFCKYLDRVINLNCVNYLEALIAGVEMFPEKLFADREFLLAAFRHDSVYFDSFFERASNEHKQDKKFILSLIQEKLFRAGAFKFLPVTLQEDPEIILALFKARSASGLFEELTEPLRNTPEIAKAAYANVGYSCDTGYEVIRHITDKDLLKSDERFYKDAVARGIFKFKELDTARQNQLKYALAAVNADSNQWEDLPPVFQNNRDLLRGMVWKALFSSETSWDETKKAPWFKAFFKDKKPQNSSECRGMILQIDRKELLELTAS